MGYDFHISRRADWAEVGKDITEEEFKRYIDSDHEFSLLEFEGGIGSLVTKWSGYKRDGEPIWFIFRNGQIEVKNPDAQILKRMGRIAEQLNAAVQGDDGETA